ncbi:dihydropteroate synthase [Methylomarinovum tepidoasis]|uniref:Dihydropteroate synthase n=2 Tax=Methylomarinovum tepidoasis TaxID=2840183 RepID=A0AAU9CAH7_9GAMM|nr:dihydropteroate synthase [Methylomarinovum sp. IN45]
MSLLERLHRPEPLIMGILNVTPDSFSDGGRYTAVEAAVKRGLEMAGAGAEIIDVGGESTRPGSEPVPAAEQVRRVVPVIEALSARLPQGVFISIDTTRAAVAEAALDAGAGLVNDVSAGRDDPKMFALVAQRRVPIVLMHMQGTPKTMQDNPCYADVVAEVRRFLWQRAEAAQAAGIDGRAIVLDPGIGFGKRRRDNLQLMAHLETFTVSGFPVLLGASRKRFMGSILEVSDPTELVAATVATTTIGTMAGVRIFRVHDVAENFQAMQVAWAIRQAR